MQLSLMSPQFLILSFTAAVLLAVLSAGVRQAAFLAANIVFAWMFLLGPRGTLSTIAFCVLGYLLTQLTRWRPRWGFVAGLGVYVLLFIYMRDYNLVQRILPETLRAQTLATVGLSFLFFKVVHVMIEARSGTLGKLEFPTYLNYCLNFSTFMMGPIQRYQDFYRQFRGDEQAIPLNLNSHIDALLRILLGFLKVYVVGEFLARFALTGDPDLLHQPPSVLLFRIYAFYFFLYFNFSGYCDVVIGIGSMLGIRPPENFDKPFIARNISEFWQRFHQSLTNWLTSYVFSPVFKWALTQRWFASRPLLAMNAALVLTMVISGLWHGTSVNFLLFGLIHGCYFVIFKTWDTLLVRRFGKQRVREWRGRWGVQLIGMLLTFNAVAFSLVFFRLYTRTALRLFGRLTGIQ